MKRFKSLLKRVKEFLKPTVGKVVLALFVWFLGLLLNSTIMVCLSYGRIVPESFVPYKEDTTINILLDIPLALVMDLVEVGPCSHWISKSPSFTAALDLVHPVLLVVEPVVFAYLLSCLLLSRRGRIVLLGVVVLYFVAAGWSVYNEKEQNRRGKEKLNNMITDYNTCSKYGGVKSVVEKGNELECTAYDGRVFTAKFEEVTVVGRMGCLYSRVETVKPVCYEWGMKAEDGTNYLLDELSKQQLYKQAMHAQKIRIVGRLLHRKDDLYKTSGYIKVSSFSILEPAPQQ